MNQEYKDLLEVVANVTQQSPDEILSDSRSLEVVDARHIFIAMLRESGVYNRNIARICGRSVRSINHAISNFESRLRYSVPMRNNLAKIRQIIGYKRDISV